MPCSTLSDPQQSAPDAALAAGFTALRVFIPQDAPEWKQEAFDQLQKIRALPDNWNGYGTPSISAALASRAAALVKSLPDNLTRGLPTPTVSPASDGLQIEWNGDGRGVEIILDFSGGQSYVLERDGRYEEGPLDIADLGAILRLLDQAFGQAAEGCQDASGGLAKSVSSSRSREFDMAAA